MNTHANRLARVPVRLTVGGLVAFVVMLSVPVRVPVAVGLKLNPMGQPAPAATVPGQLLVSPKSPVSTAPVIVSEVLPVFVSVTVCGALCVPTV